MAPKWITLLSTIVVYSLFTFKINAQNPDMIDLPNLPPLNETIETDERVIEEKDTFGSIYDPAFQSAIQQQFPLSEEQIKLLKQLYDEKQRAAAAPLNVPTPTVSSQTVSLSPGSTPPVIKMATGYVSSVVFVDETGQPWPIYSYSIGNPSAYDIQWDKTSNILLIQGMKSYQFGNMAIRLVDLDTPVMLTLVSDQNAVDYRIDLRVQGRGPNAQAPLIGGTIPEKANDILLALLDGVPPPGSERLKITGGKAEAWMINNELYLRTPLTLLSPGWQATMSSIDGTRVYQLKPAPLILTSHQGKTVLLKVEGL